MTGTVKFLQFKFLKSKQPLSEPFPSICSLQRVPKLSDAVKKILLRTLKLLFWGLLLQGTCVLEFLNMLEYLMLGLCLFLFFFYKKLLVFVLVQMCNEGGYSHAPDDLSYGVDMKKIRWCGILQVCLSTFCTSFFFFLWSFLHQTLMVWQSHDF